jgi:hypothetical protein
MRKSALIVGLGLMFLVALMAAGLIWSEDAKESPKSKVSQAIMADPQGAKAGQCPMSQNAPSDQPLQAGCQMMGGGQMGQGGMMPGCCQMMGGMMPMCPSMMGRTMACGQGPGMMEGQGHPAAKALQQLGCPNFFLKQAEELNLSDQQADELKSMKNEQHKWHIQKRADIEVAQVELEELLDQDPVNFDKVKAKLSQIGDMEKEMLMARLAVIQKAHKVLTAEQLEKAKEMKKGHPGCMGQGPRKMIKEVIIEKTPE